MIESVKTGIIVLLLLYTFIITYILYEERSNREQYLRDKVDYVVKKTDELNSRERSIIGKETCDRDLTRLKTIHRSALDVLNSYNQLNII